VDISLGGTPTVTLQERWFTEMRGGRAFGGYNSQGGVAVEFSHLQLFNPAASGVIAIVYLVLGDQGAANPLWFAHYNTALTTSDGSTRNLLSGGAAPICVIRRQTNVAQLGS